MKISTLDLSSELIKKKKKPRFLLQYTVSI